MRKARACSIWACAAAMWCSTWRCACASVYRCDAEAGRKGLCGHGESLCARWDTVGDVCAVRPEQARGLSRSTTLTLQRSRHSGHLHVALHAMAIDGSAYPGLTAQIVEGAEVPPSREAQTLYAPVAMTSNVVQNGKKSEATFQIPAHVPVERVVFGLAPGLAKVSSRGEVSVTARATKK